MKTKKREPRSGHLETLAMTHKVYRVLFCHRIRILSLKIYKLHKHHRLHISHMYMFWF